MINQETLLRNYARETPGMFILQKITFSNEYGINVVHDTKYANESFVMDATSGLTGTKVESRQVVRYEKVIDASPHFLIIYVEFKSVKKPATYIDIQKQSTPSTMWYGRSFFHLLKNVREWSLVNSEGIDINHPMGIYSSIALNEFAPSQEILKEIDEWPDMHLAKFLKQNSGYKAIPENFPEPTEKMKQWVLSLADKYKEKTFSNIWGIV